MEGGTGRGREEEMDEVEDGESSGAEEGEASGVEAGEAGKGASL